MITDSFNLSTYFDRIKYTGKTDPSVETLKALHIAHTFNIPFENLDVFYKKPPSLERDALFNKIVVNNRGGYCYEMNGLFSFVLKELGFKVADLLARGTRDGIQYFSKTHQVLMVEIDDKRYLVDVGYGNDGIAAPLLLEAGLEQQQFINTYRFLIDPEFGYVLQRKVNDTYQYMYAFKLDKCYPVDFLMSNHFSATYPESLFVKMKFCTRPTPEGRITLTDGHFKVTSNGCVMDKEISGDAEFNELLRKYFDLNLELLRD